MRRAIVRAVRWRETFELRSVRLYFTVAGLAAAICSLQPLFAVPGVEQALVLGLVLPPFAAVAGARLLVAARAKSATANARKLLAQSALVGLVGLAIPLAAALASGLRHGFCDLTSGLAFFALGPGSAVPLAALSGLVGASVTERPRIATLLAVLVPLGSIALGLWRFYDTPAVFAYAHFVGYFPGTLYDPDVAVSTPYLTLRLASAALAAALVLGFEASFDGARARLVRLVSLKGAVAFALACGVGLAEGYGPELGHRSTSASIARVLGGQIEGERCTVVYPREMPLGQVERLRDDCDFRVERAEEVLGVRHPRRITAFFFRDTDEKRRLMGASGTYIAKPWRDEVYLQLGGFPHPVLFHEIVHVVAANVGRGPFRISGSLGGLLPSAGIVEGVAVAVAWDSREDLTPHQWARALVEVGHAPSVRETEGLGFLLQPASRAYVASGSFVRWILETRGAEAVRRLYRTGSYEEALGEPLEQAEASWREFLATVPLPPHAVPMARLRFERPAIFGQVCPHALANLEADIAAALGSGDDARALRGCDAVLALDSGQTSTRAVRVGVLARQGRIAEAEAELAHLVGPPAAATPIIVRARESLADAYWQRGDVERARALLEENLAVPQPRDAKRQVELRLFAIGRGGAISATLRHLLAPDRREQHDAAVVLEALMRLDASDPSGLGSYLVARQMFARERYAEALERTEVALARGLPATSFEDEALRMRAVALYALERLDESEAAFAAIRDRARATEGDLGRVVDVEDWLARIQWRRSREPASANSHAYRRVASE